MAAKLDQYQTSLYHVKNGTKKDFFLRQSIYEDA